MLLPPQAQLACISLVNNSNLSNRTAGAMQQPWLLLKKAAAISTVGWEGQERQLTKEGAPILAHPHPPLRLQARAECPKLAQPRPTLQVPVPQTWPHPTHPAPSTRHTRSKRGTDTDTETQTRTQAQAGTHRSHTNLSNCTPAAQERQSGWRGIPRGGGGVREGAGVQALLCFRSLERGRAGQGTPLTPCASGDGSR